ncbi:MAG: hypothetical protein EP335_14285 [Alphaproteobacteria bacterium]|nr:MAG: hypothetical protein EP335_14285 [Alphaproteobacteria bacterium]
MKKLGLLVASFFWALFIGELVGSIAYHNGFVLQALSLDTGSTEDVARLLAMLVTAMLVAFLIVALLVPLGLALRKKSSALISALAATSPIVLLVLLDRVVTGNAVEPSIVTAVALAFLRGFLVLYPALILWPKPTENYEGVFD